MNILLEDFSLLGFGGGQRYSIILLSSLVSFQQQVSVLAIGPIDLFHKNLVHYNLKPESIPITTAHSSIRLFSLIVLFARLTQAYLSIDCCTFISTTRLTSILLFIVSSLLPLRSHRVIHIHHLYPSFSPVSRVLYKLLLSSRRSTNLFPSNFLSNAFHQHFSSVANSFVLPPPPVILPTARPKLLIPLFETGLPTSNPLKFTYIGMIHPHKGIFKLLSYLKTFHELADSPSFVLHIYGTGPEIFIRKLYSELQNSGLHVVYYGNTDIIQSTYSDSDIVFVPSWNIPETLSFTALEAITYAPCVLMANHGVLSEYSTYPHAVLCQNSLPAFLGGLVTCLACAKIGREHSAPLRVNSSTFHQALRRILG